MIRTERGVNRRITGLHAVAAALREQPERVSRLIVQATGRVHPARDVLVEEARASGVSVVAESEAYFDALAPGKASQGIAAELAPFVYADLDELLGRLVAHTAVGLVLDGVTDPQNLGSILRSCAFFGAHFVVLPRDRSVEVTPTVEKVSCGGAATVPVCQVTNLARALGALKEAGFWVYGTVVDGGELPMRVDLRGRCALVLGSEGAGMRRLVRETCDALLTLPGAGPVGSLNVGVFAAIALYEVHRQNVERG